MRTHKQLTNDKKKLKRIIHNNNTTLLFTILQINTVDAMNKESRDQSTIVSANVNSSTMFSRSKNCMQVGR